MRPYLVIPELIPQPTWGGNYICDIKGWLHNKEFGHMIVGQSHELAGDTLLSNCLDSSDHEFGPKIRNGKNYFDESNVISLQTLIDKGVENVLGPSLSHTHNTMPVLIKLNQAKGNSFQLHIKPGQTHTRWRPKPESWYFIEDGLITCGIRPECDIANFKNCCLKIAENMQQLSDRAVKNELSVQEARALATDYIRTKNPWQYVQKVRVKKNSSVNLSAGGVTHSWEEPGTNIAFGNIIYEVQRDVQDESCTIRAFDQGKIKDDGTIRPIHVEDFFSFLDADLSHNAIENLISQPKENGTVMNTPYYMMDVCTISGTKIFNLRQSFHHLYVQSGDIEVRTKSVAVRAHRGHSIFIPYGVGTYEIVAHVPQSVIFHTYVD